MILGVSRLATVRAIVLAKHSPKRNVGADELVVRLYLSLVDRPIALAPTPSVPQYMPSICQNIDVSRHVLVYRYIHFWTNESQVFWNGGSKIVGLAIDQTIVDIHSGLIWFIG